ncbi:uncharacterized protein LOC127007420 [Eriocheir sinensis]|uniref:uncharacterized protein LOC127007420 n=1 Tax=Eriocheir sinensis TaxID=95602 RepID=UPI0021C815BE|nr:uncharacterized protein LOC127007420 [Eriocheir sinensis]XP_050734371.1 uncharacterized protein LOC127007420 [Eriocheir sinensis]
MTSAEAVQVRREVVRVGPPYLYNGAQVCGRKVSRTCIFLLATFGAALTMIGVVFFTADLRRTSGLWVAGVVFIPVGVVLLVWFLVLCCAARRTFRALPASHPARKPSRGVLLPAHTSSTYELLPMTPSRTHVTPAPQRTTTHTLPLPGTHKVSRATQPNGYPTWGYGWNERRDMAGQPRVQAAVDTWDYSAGLAMDYNGLRGYPPDCTMMEYDRHPLTAHTLGRPSPGLQRGSYAAGHNMMTLSSTLASPAAQRGDDSPPPYHSIVSGP